LNYGKTIFGRKIIMRSHFLRVTALCLFSLCLGHCASSASAPEEAPADTLTLDQAIEDIAAYFTGRLPASSAVAITRFEADTENLCDYMAEELWNHFEKAGAFVMADRRNLEKIREEMRYQLSGEVGDESARALGQRIVAGAARIQTRAFYLRDYRGHKGGG
jgi:curli biogenesis system outer membrane secretion channel CsgG